MPLKQELLKKVPQHLKEEPYFAALLDSIKENKIESKTHLAEFLHAEISRVEKWLEENKAQGATAVKTIRDKAIKLNVLRRCAKLTQEFLF